MLPAPLGVLCAFPSLWTPGLGWGTQELCPRGWQVVGPGEGGLGEPVSLPRYGDHCPCPRSLLQACGVPPTVPRGYPGHGQLPWESC